MIWIGPRGREFATSPVRQSDFNECVGSEAVAVDRVALGEPMSNATLHLAKKVEPALLSQMPEIADQIRDRMFVDCPASLLKYRQRFSDRSDVFGFINHPSANAQKL